MKQPEDGVDRFDIAVGLLKHRASLAILFIAGMDAGLFAVADIAAVKPAGKAMGLALSMAVSVLAGENVPAVAFLAVLSQFDDDGFQLVDHVTTFLDKLHDDFDLIAGNIVAHEYLWSLGLI
jgi:hypothetical protein